MADRYERTPVNILGLPRSNLLELKLELSYVLGDGAFYGVDFLPQLYNDEDGS